MILFFSGTGNSEAVANELARLTGDEIPVCIMPEERIPESNPAGRYIWVFPTYSWNVPPVVQHFIRKVSLPEGNRCKHYMVTVCGDDTGLTALSWRKLIREKGWKDSGAFSVQMPNNYIAFPGFDVDSPEVEKAKIDAMPARVACIADKILSGFSGEDTVRGTAAWFKTKVIYPLFKASCMSPGGFSVNPDKCIRCGKCQRNCPCSNIGADSRGLPVWDKNCAFCLRCYHICPTRAITHGIFSKNKGQYLFRNIR